MKKIYFTKVLSTILILTLVFSMTACGKNGEKDNGSKEEPAKKTLKVGVSAGPYGDMFAEAIAPSLEKKGYQVDIVEFSDYVQPNLALANKEIDLNMFQHSVYLKNFCKENKLDLTYIKEIPTAGMGVFSGKYKSIDDVPNGATIAIPNDPTNLSRAIRVLEQTGIITIDPSVDPAKATQFTLSKNPKNLNFIEIEAPALPRSLDSTDLAVINGNFAIGAGLNLSDALYNEKIAEGYINVIAVRTEDKEAQFAKDIVEVVKSDAFKKVIENPKNQYVSFQRPADY